MGDISKKEYDALDLRGSMQYYSVGKQKCINPECKECGKEVEFNSDKPPHDFIYAKTLKGIVRNIPIKYTCMLCTNEMETTEVEYFKKPEDQKFSVNVPKAKGDRSRNYYRDYSKQSWKDDPTAGQKATQLSKDDIKNFEKRMNS